MLNMFKYIFVRYICTDTRKYLSTIPQISLQNKTVNSNNSSIAPDKAIGNVNTEVAIYRRIPYIQPKTVSSFYINESEILQELFKLNVNLYEVEQVTEAFDYLLPRKFDDIKDHIIFLKELKLKNEEIGEVITKNPLLLKEDLEDLKVRINYLQYKKFSNEMIKAIIHKNPFWLSHR